MENIEWLSLTQYALQNHVSISTLRRKIKSNSIEFKMEDGKYLLRSSSNQNRSMRSAFSFVSDDAPPTQQSSSPSSTSADLHWKALEARVAGLVRKVDLMAEQMSELKMLVQIFEEKLEARE